MKAFICILTLCLSTTLSAQELPFEVLVKNEKGQFIANVDLEVFFEDGSTASHEMKNLGQHGHTDSLKLYRKSIKYFEIAVNIHTSDFFNEGKLIFAEKVKDLDLSRGYLLQLEGSYNRPYINAKKVKSEKTKLYSNNF